MRSSPRLLTASKMTNPKIDEYGRTVEDEQSLIELFYQGITEITASGPEVDRFNSFCDVFDMLDSKISGVDQISETPEEFHAERQRDWIVPEEFMNFDIVGFLRNAASTEAALDRVNFELEVFEALDMLDSLRAIRYVVHTLDEHNVVRGVGRGSSVSSYCLFLLGVHMVDSLNYGLDFAEFLSVR